MNGSRKSGADAEARGIRDYYARVADLLDRALRDRPDEAYWRRVAERRGGTLLEVGAGTGRITRLLAPGRPLTVAFDLSPGMLRRARTALRSLPDVCLLAADVRELRLEARFELAAAANDPLAHLVEGADRDRALTRIAAHLAPGGRFLHDALWLSPRRAAEAASPRGHRRKKRVEGDGPPLEIRERWRRVPGSTRHRVTYRYLSEGTLLREARTELRPWSPSEVRRRYRRAGLRIVSLLGDYDDRPWSAGSATTLLVEAERP